MSKSKSGKIQLNQSLWEFFRVEIRNEDAGGVSPSTLRSALDSFSQADNETLGNWFGIVNFTEELKRIYCAEIKTLMLVLGEDAQLETLLRKSAKKQDMNKYRVHVCRTAYSHLDIVVEAYNKSDAMKLAHREAGDHVFPTENASEYSVEGCTKIA